MDAFNISTIRFDMGMRRSDFAEIISISPLNLRFFDGSLFTFGYTRSSLFHAIGPGDVVFVDVEVESTGFWVSTALAISKGDFNGPGELIAAGWTVADGSSLDLAQQMVQYSEESCIRTDDNCGPIITRALTVSIDGETVSLTPGDTAKLGAYTVGNGLSFRYDGQV